MPKILHTGDIHLDTKSDRLPEDLRKIRKKELREVFENIVTLANAHAVDIVLIAGDLFDAKTVSPDTIDYVSNLVSTTPNIKYFISPGNHDPFIPSSQYATYIWPHNVHIFNSTQISCVEIPELNTRVYGAAFVAEHCSSPLLENFKCNNYDGVNIIVMHGDILKGSQYNPISANDISNSNANYVALGHVHLKSDVQISGNVRYAYCGTPEAHGFDECGEKGVYIGEVSNEKTDLKFVAISKRQYHKIVVEVTFEMTQEDIMQKISSLSNFSSNDLVKYEVFGETNADINWEEIKSEFNSKCFYVKWQIDTKIKLEKTAYADNSPIGIFKKNIENLMDKAETQEEKDKYLKALEFGILTLEGRNLEI